MKRVDWAVVPSHITRRLACQAIEGFCRDPTSPDHARDFAWHWAPFSKEVARVRLPKPVLRVHKPGAYYIHVRTVYIKPAWEMSGGAREKERATTPLRMTARVGWNDTYRIAVLFFAEGGILQPPLVHA